ncbi:MAG: hypothetical protein RPR97_01020 [Colwellia sp.]|jgi:hypothetical protein
MANEGIELSLILFPFCVGGGLLGAGVHILKLSKDGVKNINKKASFGIGAALGLGVFCLSYGAISPEWESALRMGFLAMIAGYKNSDLLEDNEKLMDQVLTSKLKSLS